MSLGYYEDWSKAVLGRRRRVRARDWKAARRWMDRTDKALGARKAWILGGSAGDAEDQPCIVFLTNRALYVEVRPYEGRTPGLIVAPFHMIATCEIGGNDVGGTRLAFLLDTKGRQNPAGLRSIAVELPRGRRGAAFGRLVVDTVGPRAGETARRAHRAR
jgi:hypothetical protein